MPDSSRVGDPHEVDVQSVLRCRPRTSVSQSIVVPFTLNIKHTLKNS